MSFLSRRARLGALCASTSVAFIVVVSSSARATDYTFTKIVDNSTLIGGNTYSQFGYGPTINDLGQVAFTATNFPASGVFVSSGGPVTTIATTGPQFFGNFYNPTIGNNGVVAFQGQGNDFSTQIHTGTGGATTLIVKADFGATSFNGYTFVNIGQPSMNNNGDVIFSGNLYGNLPNGNSSGIFVGGNGNPLALNYGYGTVFGRINDSGQTSFAANKNATQTIVTRRDANGTIHEFATSDFSLINPPPEDYANLDPRVSLNNVGNVAFQSQLRDNSLVIRAFNGTHLVTMAQTSSNLVFPYYTQLNGGPAISDGGVVVFQGTMVDPNDFMSRYGIFTGTHPVNDAVIRQYDPLFGGYVNNLGFVSGVNAHGQIAFQYVLEDIFGTPIGSGIAVATPSTSANISTTGNVAPVQVGGGSQFIGGLDADFSNVLDEGRFSSDYFSSPTADELAVRIGQEAADEAFFDTAGAEIQTWNLHYSGEFAGGVELVFHYDVSTLTVDEADLVIRHFTGGEWVTPAQVLNTDDDTITMTVSDFSPFILSSGPVALPEPTSLGILAIGALTLLTRRRRSEFMRELRTIMRPNNLREPAGE